MRVDRTHFPWLLAILLATAFAGFLYIANYHPQRLPFPMPLPAFFGEVPPTVRSIGGTPLGLTFGIIAYAIFLFAAALGIRKKRRRWPIGNVQTWLKAHLWLTVLTIPLVLFHSGFRLGGTLTSWVMLLYAVVMISGIFGIILQQFMPRLMKDRLPHEVVFEEIPFLRDRLFEAAAKLRQELRQFERAPALANARSTAPKAEEDPSIRALATFLDDHAMPYLSAHRGDRLPLGDSRNALALFRATSMNVSAEWKPRITEIQSWCDERRAMDLQTKYQHWLHGWLLIHVPVSMALLVFTAWHAWAGLHFATLSP